ncbi:MAG: methyltransferase domain-containing protein [Nanoarchaeota archaeon]|nr:methyltransferase domain-containing protein [Nanoarchaeota archaeon]
MTEWFFWGDKKFLDVYGNIYLRTNVEDWFNIVKTIAKEFVGDDYLDIGCGEGHTTKQILDRISKKYVCDLIEPDKKALEYAKKYLRFENNIGKSFVSSLKNFKSYKKYDTIFTSHTNYYWAENVNDYDEQLRKLLSLLKEDGKLLILTLPEDSHHYRIMLKDVYPRFVFAEYIINFYKKLGLNVEVKKFNMNMFVGDILNTNSTYELKNFYRFIHNTKKSPTSAEEKKFLQKIEQNIKNGYLNFKDELIIIKK